MVTAVVIIVVFALLSAALVSIFLRSSEATLRLQAIPKAAALAEGGLDQAGRNLIQANLSARQTCVNLATTTTLSTGNSIAARASNIANNPRYAYAVLTAAIPNNTSPTTITVADSSVFAPDGWVLIGREVFQYSRIADVTTLAGVMRAQDGSVASEQVVGATVSQYQCYIAGIGQSPATNPVSIREYQQGMRQPVLFAVGQSGTVLRWNAETAELAWASQASGTTLDLYAVSALNYHEAWAVASQSSSAYQFARLQGNAPWLPIAAALGNAVDLLGVDATSSKEAWAVGRKQGNNTTILRWVRNANNDSTNWCSASLSSCPGITMTEASIKNSQKDIYAVKTYDLNGDGFADMGFAVGGNSDNSAPPADKGGVIWYYSGTGWGPITKAPLSFILPENVDLLSGLDITPNGNAAPLEAFFVGQNMISGGELLRLRIVNGAAVWVAINPAQTLHAVSVEDTNGDGLADFGCAVGSNGLVVFFDSAMNPTYTTLTNNPNLNGIVVINSSDIWVIGDGGVSFHYDGTSWTSMATTTSNNLNSLSAVFPKQTNLSRWHELIN